MTSFRLTPLAQKDLSSIWDYTHERWGMAQAATYLTDVRQAIERVAQDPRRGSDCGFVRAGYRKYGIGSHLILCVERTGGVDVIRVLHQRMDPSRHR